MWKLVFIFVSFPPIVIFEQPELTIYETLLVTKKIFSVDVSKQITNKNKQDRNKIPDKLCTFDHNILLKKPQNTS